MSDLELLCDAIGKGNRAEATRLTRALLAAGGGPQEIVDRGLVAGMGVVAAIGLLGSDIIAASLWKSDATGLGGKLFGLRNLRQLSLTTYDASRSTPP